MNTPLWKLQYDVWFMSTGEEEGDLEHMKRLQMIDLTVAGFKRSPSNQQRHMEYHYFKNSWHLLHNGSYENVKYDPPNRQHFLHNGAIFEYVNKIWWKRLLNNGLPLPYHYGRLKHCQICWIGGMSGGMQCEQEPVLSIWMRSFDAV